MSDFKIPAPLLAVVAEIAAARGESINIVATNLIFSGLCWHGPERPYGVDIDFGKLSLALDECEAVGGGV
jgi:hypothetical protein